MRRKLWIWASLLVLLIVTACTPKVAPGAAPAPPVAPLAPAPARAAWEEDWEMLVAAAKKEGKLILYTSGGAATTAVRDALSQALKAKFEIAVESVGGRGAEIVQKLTAQRRGGVYLADVYVGGSTTVHTQLRPGGVVEPLKPVLILPEVLGPSVWWEGKLRFLDDGRSYNLGLIAYAGGGMAVNTELAKSGEIKGYLDLLNPRWKGKIILGDPTTVGVGGKVFGVVGSRILNWDFWREMVKQEPLIITDERLMVEWVSRGKYTVLVAANHQLVEEFRKVGAPLSLVPPIEGSYLTSGPGSLALINRAPHPNAARVFINWLASKEGSTVFSRAMGVPAARLDVPTEGIDPVVLLKPGVKYVESDDEKFSREQPEYFKLAREIFAPLLKR